MNEKVTSGVSIENASYIDNNFEDQTITSEEAMDLNVSSVRGANEELTPQLFSEENNDVQEKKINLSNETTNEKIFDQDINEDEDFEIPAFLRKQKF